MVDDITGEFEDADLKDPRRNRRLSRIAAALAAFPAASIAAATGGHAEMMAAYRLLNCPDVTAAAVLAPHREATITRCAAHRRVVVSQDTTELDFTHMTATTGLGPLNDKDRKGLYLHALYAVSGDGLPLGALNAAMIIRDPATFGGANPLGCRVAHPLFDTSRTCCPGFAMRQRVRGSRMEIDVCRGQARQDSGRTVACRIHRYRRQARRPLGTQGRWSTRCTIHLAGVGPGKGFRMRVASIPRRMKGP